MCCLVLLLLSVSLLTFPFFFNLPATTEFYSLSLTTLFRSVSRATPFAAAAGRSVSTASLTMSFTPLTWSSRTRSEEHTSELQSLRHLVCRLLLEKKKQHTHRASDTTITPTTAHTSDTPTKR